MDFGKDANVNSDEIKDIQGHIDDIKNGKIKNYIFLALSEDGNEVNHTHCHGTIAAGLLHHAITEEDRQYNRNKQGEDLLKAFLHFNEDDD